MSDLVIRQFACLGDNYGFLLHDPVSGRTASIDAPDAAVISAQAERQGWRITEIWNTHWHHDHAGGNAELKNHYACSVLAPAEVMDKAGMPVDRILVDNDRIEFGARSVEIMAIPGHTLGHIGFYLADDGLAFVGDTLFALGCGRLFEGSPEQMWNSLLRLRALPPETRVFCAHEYTKANAAFALEVDPDNEALLAYSRRVESLRASGLPTVPTMIAAEREANPFLRADNPELQRAVGMSETIAAFAELRRRKDVF